MSDNAASLSADLRHHSFSCRLLLVSCHSQAGCRRTQVITGIMPAQALAKILFVDDEPLIRWTLKEALRGWGYDPIEAKTAAEALELFAQTQPAAVLLDINLPDGSGLELLREFKQRNPQTIIVMVTGEVLIENTIAALRGGADDFIGKPINLPELEYALQARLEKQSKGQSTKTPSPPRLLIVTDSVMRRRQLSNAFSSPEIEITSVRSVEEFNHACLERHDLVVIDLEPDRLKEALKMLRDSAAHADIPLLVDVGRISSDRSLAGVLPQFRAMPCNPNEMVALARRRMMTMTTPATTRTLL